MLHLMSVKKVALCEPEGRREETSQIIFTTRRGDQNDTAQLGEGERFQPPHPEHKGTRGRNDVTMATFVNRSTIDTGKGATCVMPAVGPSGLPGVQSRGRGTRDIWASAPAQHGAHTRCSRKPRRWPLARTSGAAPGTHVRVPPQLLPVPKFQSLAEAQGLSGSAAGRELGGLLVADTGGDLSAPWHGTQWDMGSFAWTPPPTSVEGHRGRTRARAQAAWEESPDTGPEFWEGEGG